MAKQENIADVLVIGAGASGGAFVWSLAEAGFNVVCLEQGGWVPLNAFPTDQPDSLLHWQTDFHPNPNLRGLAEDYPVNENESPISPLMYNAVGGSLIHWGSHFPRFHPSDFRVKTLDGVADDWPMTYQELEPYYDINVRMKGVSGLRGDPAYPPKPERPCPPLAIGRGGEAVARGFNKLGWHWWAADNAVSSMKHDGRDPDYGGYLRSFSSSDIIYWPKALMKGAQLKTHARVREIVVDKSGRAEGALYYDAQGNLVLQKAKVVVMACNGIGTPRLLLNSKSRLFPEGLANSSGLVGKNLMHHPCGVVLGIFMPPLATALGGLLGQPVSWGENHHKDFSERFGHLMGITLMTEDLPEEHNQVTLDPVLTDSHGIPAAKVQYTVSDNTNKMLDHAVERGTEVLEAAGAKQVLSSRLRRNAGWHLLGTARMGDDPNNSVVDRWGRAHDVPNLFVIDGSIFTTGACINPTTTIEALALRTADYLKGEGSAILT
jgi:choline dehydrogenase-like flavoprotein